MGGFQDIFAIMFEEIALEGLDGITLESLWNRLQANKKFEMEIDLSSKSFIWKILSQAKHISFYTLPTPRQTIPLYLLITENPKLILKLRNLLNEIYPYKNLDMDNEPFSCDAYHTRKDVSEIVRTLKYEEVVEKYGNHLVLVENLKRRIIASFGNDVPLEFHGISHNRNIFPIMEKIARSRTAGLSANKGEGLRSIIPDPGTLNYFLKNLLAKKYLCRSIYFEGLKKSYGYCLPQFYDSTKTVHFSPLFCILKEWNARYMAMSEFYRRSKAHAKKKGIQHFVGRSEQNGLIAVHKKILYRHCFLNLKEDDCFYANGVEREVKAIELLVHDENEFAKIFLSLSQNPTENDDASDCEEEEEQSNTVEGCLDFNLPLIYQIYNKIQEGHSKGVSLHELSKLLQANYFSVRHLLQKLVKEKKISQWMEQIGRKRVIRYYVSKYENDNKSNKETVVEAPSSNNIVSSLNQSRRSIILTTLKENNYANKRHLLNQIIQTEKSQGSEHTICSKSLHRLLKQMIEENLVQLFNIGFSPLYALPGVREGDVIVATLKGKSNKSNSSEPDTTEHFLQRLVTEARTDWAHLKLAKELRGENSDCTEKIKKYPVAPKFVRLSILHDFIFYLVRDYTGIQNKPQSELREVLMSAAPEVRDLTDMPTLYADNITNYMFIPPCLTNDKYPGWCVFATIFMSLPLCLFSKIVRIHYSSEELDSYMEHPIQKHYPVRNLPETVRMLLIKSGPISALRTEMNRLSFMGLIQYGPRSGHKAHLDVIYVNTKATLLDTAKSPTGYLKIDQSINYKTIKYDFKTKLDVKSYWIKFFNLSFSTKLGALKFKKPKNLEECERDVNKEELRACAIMKPVADVLANDTGQIPGDHLGVGGLDSSLMSFARQNWMPSMPTSIRSYAEKTPEARALAKSAAIRKRKELKLGKIIKKDRDKKIIYDSLDYEALKKVKTLRAVWTPQEDTLLILCKAALQFLCPDSRKYCRIPITMIRAFLWRHCEKSLDKTQRAIARRMAHLSKKNLKNFCQTTINSIVQILKLTKECVLKYDTSTLQLQIKPTAPNLSELMESLKAKFYDLMEYMVKRFLLNGKIVLELSQNLLPSTVEELNRMYTLKEPEPRPVSLQFIQEASIQAIIMSSIACSNEKVSLTTQLFHIYRQFDEGALRSVLQNLKDNKIISTIKFNIMDASEIDLLPLKNTPYRFSQRFHFYMLMKYKHDVYHIANNEFIQLVEKNKSPMEVSLFNGGPAVFSLVNLGIADLRVEIPDQFVVFNSLRFPKEKADKIMARYTDIVDNFEMSKGKRKFVDTDESESPEKKKKCEDLNTSRSSNDSEDAAGETNMNFRSARLALYALRDVTNEELAFERGALKSMDLFGISNSKVFCQAKTFLPDAYPDISKKYKRLLQDIIECTHVNGPLDEQTELNDLISKDETLARLWYQIDESGPIGVTARELHDGRDRDAIALAVNTLCSSDAVRVLGLNETTYVAKKHINPWTVESFKINRSVREKIPSKNFSVDSSLPHESVSLDLLQKSNVISKTAPKLKLLMRPWLRVEGTVNRRVLDRFLGIVLSYIMTNPGISLANVMNRFSPALIPVWTKELVDVLAKLDCVALCAIARTPPSLFSAGSFQLLGKPKGLELNEEIVLEPNVDAILNLSRFISFSKLYTKDFVI